MTKMRSKKIKKFLLILAMAALLGAYFFLRSIYVVPVLMYHNIDENYRESKLSVSPESFKRQMKFLKMFNYNIVSLNELTGLLKAKKPIPYKTVAITFDDGYKNNYTAAYPVMKKYNIPASIFVVVSKVGREDRAGWDELRQMSEDNIHIGSHTLSECYLPDIKDVGRLKDEIFESRNAIKSRIPEGGDFIAYCSGGFNKEIRQLVIDAGYKGACATNPGNKYSDDDIYALKRVRISRTSDSLFVFWIETSGFYTWIKEHRDED
ncbi:MAG: polysaccharide deacetylase family protein [Candidatus Omnitrophota bacterium]